MASACPRVIPAFGPEVQCYSSDNHTVATYVGHGCTSMAFERNL
jgi:hypothetical protein